MRLGGWLLWLWGGFGWWWWWLLKVIVDAEGEEMG